MVRTRAVRGGPGWVYMAVDRAPLNHVARTRRRHNIVIGSITLSRSVHTPYCAVVHYGERECGT